MKTLIIEMLFNKKTKVEHLDGSFYYPTKGGIGYITEKLEDYCGVDNIHKNSQITKIIRNNTHVQAVEINHTSRRNTEHVINTLPLSQFLKMLEPPPPQNILNLVDQMKYRSLILVALFLDRTSISPNASIYFPEKNIPFTRIYEPKNRNISMAPSGKTSLVAEIPCQYEDKTWRRSDDEHEETVISQLVKMNFIKKAEIVEKQVKRMRYTYPILEVNFENKIKTLREYLTGFSNLDITGRNAKFEYIHNHDLMREGLKIIKKLKS
jgi:protoporphyrinogen oxidase